MKKRSVVTLIVSIIAILSICFAVWPRLKVRRTSPVLGSVGAPTTSPPAMQEKTAQSGANTFGTDQTNLKAIDADKKMWDLWLATPIAFFGRVIDEHGDPVAHANIEVSFTDHVWEGNTKLKRTADDTGFFQVSGHGLGITVGVSKPGYQRLKQSDQVFAYSTAAGQTNTHTQAENPAVFMLRKMGNPASLVTFERDFSILSDGRPVRIDLARAQPAVDAAEAIQVQVWVDRVGGSLNLTSERYNWRSVISINGGGLSQRDDESEFEAPAEGYKPSDEINMPLNVANWRSQLARQYFVRLPSGTFARIELTISTGSRNPFLTVKSYLNPTPGDRNLEFDPAKEIKVR